jgi:MFS family permease
MYTYFIPVFAQRFGATFFDLGLIGSAVALASAITPTCVGYCADRMNRAWLFSFAVVINVATTLALVLSKSVRDIVLLRLVGGLALGFYYPTVEVLVTDLAPLEMRVKEMGRYSAASAAGFLIGPMLGGLVIQEMGFMRLFVFSAIVIMVSFIQVTMWIVPSYGKRKHFAFEFTGSLRTIRRLLPWYMMAACYAIIISVIATIFPGYANSVGISAAFIGFLFAAFGTSRIFVFLTSERFLMLGERRVLLVASLLISVGIVVLGIYPSFFTFLAAIILIGGCSGVIFPITIGLISRHFPEEKLGAAVGSYETAAGIGQAVGPLLAGIVASLTSAEFSFLSTALFGLLMAIFVVIGRTYSFGST